MVKTGDQTTQVWAFKQNVFADREIEKPDV